MKFCFVMIVMVAAIMFGFWNLTFFHNISGDAVGLRVAAGALLFVAIIYSCLRIFDRFTAFTWTKWWDPASSPDGVLDWKGLNRLLDRNYDPISFHSGIRRRATAVYGILTILIVVVIIGVAGTSARFLLDPQIPTFLFIGNGNRVSAQILANLNNNLTAFLALIAASVSIWFTYSQLRAKVRADNRQVWLSRTRFLIARVVTLGAAQYSAYENKEITQNKRKKRIEKIHDELDPLRIELELMLNPSEKDHRLLIHLLRRLALLHDTDRADLADDGIFVDELKQACARIDAATNQNYVRNSYDLDWCHIVETVDHAKLVTYTVKLGHIVLKREWERVKNTR